MYFLHVENFNTAKLRDFFLWKIGKYSGFYGINPKPYMITNYAFVLQTGPDVFTTETMGVNYRSLNDLFEIQQARKDMIAYTVCVQMLEIYNEMVRDLLSTDGATKKYPFLHTLLVFCLIPFTYHHALSSLCS